MCFGTLLAWCLGTWHGIRLRFGTLALGLLGCKVVVCSDLVLAHNLCFGVLLICFGVSWAGSLGVLVAFGPSVRFGALGEVVVAPTMSSVGRLGAWLAFGPLGGALVPPAKGLRALCPVDSVASPPFFRFAGWGRRPCLGRMRASRSSTQRTFSPS